MPADASVAVRPARGRFAAAMADVGEAVAMWPVWLRLALQDIRLRFRRSWFGAAWIAINLCVVAGAIAVVYGGLFGQDIRSFLPYLLVGLVIWGYLSATITEGGQAFLASEGYITQIGLPVYVHILRFFVRGLVVGLVSVSVYVPVALACGIGFAPGLLAVVPGLALVAVVGLLLTAIFSYLNARFRDTGNLAGAMLQVLFLVTPVIWPADSLRSRALGWIVDWNPLYHVLEVVRRPLLLSEPAAAASYLAVAGLIAVLAAIAAVLTARYYRRVAYLL